MLFYMCDESKMPPTGPQLEHAIKRNFGGFKSEKFNPFEEFTKLIPIDPEIPPQVPEEVFSILFL